MNGVITDWNPREFADALAVAENALRDSDERTRATCAMRLATLRPKVERVQVVLVLGCTADTCANSSYCRGEELLEAASLLLALPEDIRTRTDPQVLKMIRALSSHYGLLIGLAFRRLCGSMEWGVRNAANKLNIELHDAAAALQQRPSPPQLRLRFLEINRRIRQFVESHQAHLGEEISFAPVLAEFETLEALEKRLR